MADSQKTCVVGGCNSKAHSAKRGHCIMHYSRLQRNGHYESNATKPGSLQAWLKGHVQHPDKDACLIWPYGRTGSGYGQFKSKGKCYLAHRWMCEAVNGAPPRKNSHAAHSCGNGHLGCVNPHHLRWATPKENVQDKREHGRMPMGESHHNATLTDGQVMEIISLRGAISHAKIAALYGVSKGAVDWIMAGRSWSWLTGQKPPASS